MKTLNKNTKLLCLVLAVEHDERPGIKGTHWKGHQEWLWQSARPHRKDAWVRCGQAPNPQWSHCWTGGSAGIRPKWIRTAYLAITSSQRSAASFIKERELADGLANSIKGRTASCERRRNPIVKDQQLLISISCH